MKSIFNQIKPVWWAVIVAVAFMATCFAPAATDLLIKSGIVNVNVQK